MYVWHDDVFYNCSDDFARSAAFLKTVYETESDLLYICEDDLPLFCAAALPAIEEHLDVSAPEELDSYRPVPGSVELYFDKTPKRIVCDARVSVRPVHAHPARRDMDLGKARCASSPARRCA